MHVRSIGLAVALLSLGLASGCTPAPAPRSAADAPAPASPRASAPPLAAPPVPYLATLTVDAESAPVFANPSNGEAAVARLAAGDRLRLVERRAGWFRVRTPSGAEGWVEPASLVSPACAKDRPEPLVVEEPVFRFSLQPPHGAVVVEAEFTAEASLVSTRVLQNSLASPSFERIALEDLRALRFLPPTSGCKARAFFYTFTRRF